METFILLGGIYSVFDYKGPGNDLQIFQFIFGTWLPNSIYSIDNKTHSEIIGKIYKYNDSVSEEEIWIPIKLKE